MPRVSKYFFGGLSHKIILEDVAGISWGGVIIYIYIYIHAYSYIYIYCQCVYIYIIYIYYSIVDISCIYTMSWYHSSRTYLGPPLFPRIRPRGHVFSGGLTLLVIGLHGQWA